MSFFSSCPKGLTTGSGLDQVLSQLPQDDFIAQQLGRLIIDEKYVDLIWRAH